jgi:hypothetical protein
MEHFDMACGFIDAMPKHYFNLEPMIRDARLFCLEDRIQSHWQDISQEDEEILQKLFHLPYRTTAIEDKDSVIILGSPEGDPIGLCGHKYLFIEVARRNSTNTTNMMSDGTTGSFTAGSFSVIGKELNKPPIIKIGVAIVGHKINNKFQFNSINELENQSPGIAEILFKERIANIGVVLEEIRRINLPSNLIVEISANSKTPKPKGVPRSNARPHYVLLKPGEIRTKYIGFDTGEGTKKTAHERRRHLRLLSSDYYVNKKGQYIVIPASWIGKTEYTQDHKTYKVILDN